MRAALGWHQGVDLVDDDDINRSQCFAGVRREQQVERFRSCNQDVGRLALKARALGGRRVARPDGDDGNVVPVSACNGAVCDSGKRGAQVALDVNGQRLERRDVEDTAPRGWWWRRFEEQPVETPQERRERLAAARRRQNQRRVAARDRRPALDLRRCRCVERRAEPLRDCGMKNVQNVAASHGFIVPLCIQLVPSEMDSQARQNLDEGGAGCRGLADARRAKRSPLSER